MATRTARINALRGFCREFGVPIAQGARVGLEQIARVLADPHSAIPQLVRSTMNLLLEDIRLLEARIGHLERGLALSARASAPCTTLLTIPDVGLLTSTAMVAATSGNVSHFRDARHFSAWFGLTPKEYSSGNTRRIGRISKRGDPSLRACCSPMAHARCCAPRRPRPKQDDRSIGCARGRSRCRHAPTTTRPLAHWPTSSRASATPACATPCSTASPAAWRGRSRAAPIRSRPEARDDGLKHLLSGAPPGCRQSTTTLLGASA
jgi:transposase